MVPHDVLGAMAEASPDRLRQRPDRGGYPLTVSQQDPQPGAQVEHPRRVRAAGEERRFLVLRSGYVVLFLVASLFSLLNFATGVVLLGFIEGATAVAAVVAAALLLRRDCIIAASWSLLGLAALALLAVHAYPETSQVSYLWGVIYPLVALYLLGPRVGLAVSAVFFVLASCVFFASHGIGSSQHEILSSLEMLLIWVGVALFAAYYEMSRSEAEAALTALANSDPLTRLPNRPSFQAHFERERARAQRSGRPISLLLVDADHFKRVNDTLGHQAGDAALCHLGELMRSKLRSSDLLARVGGEEFAVLLPETGLQGGLAAAQQLCRAVRENPFRREGAERTLTVSIGVAELASPSESFEALFARADAGLYDAKAEGRDRAVALPPGPRVVQA